MQRLRKENKKIYLDKNIIIHHLGGLHDSINFEMNFQEIGIDVVHLL